MNGYTHRRGSIFWALTLIAIGSLIVALVQLGDWQRALAIAGSSGLVAAILGSLFSPRLAGRQSCP